MKELEERLKQFKPTPENRRIAEDQYRRLLNQLAYLSNLYNLLERLERVKIGPLDDAHRELFKETQFQPKSFRNRMGRISSCSKKIYEILREYNFDLSIKEVAKKIHRTDYGSLWDRELEKIDIKLVPIDKKKYVPKFRKKALIEAIVPHKKYFLDSHFRVAERGLEVLIDISRMLSKLSYEYESALAKEGLIKQKHFGTPTSLDIIGRAILATLGIGYVAFDAFSSKEAGSVFAGLGMCVTATLIGH